jgi:predicted peptidase
VVGASTGKEERMSSGLKTLVARIAMATLCLSAVANCAGRTPEHPRTGQHAYRTRQVNYLLFLPETYGQDPAVKWPLMVFLHGISKRGDTLGELEALKTDGPPMIVEDQLGFPFVVLSPQCPSGEYWESQYRSLERLLDDIVDTYAVDTGGIYLTGLSMGGFGAWHWALRDPSLFAAVVPIAGGHVHGSDEVPENICDLKDLPVWAFHGGADDVVLPMQSEVLVEGLQACDADVRFTLYPDADHAGSWKRAYADSELYDWLLSQTLAE